jgi:hypothetical protein
VQYSVARIALGCAKSIYAQSHNIFSRETSLSYAERIRAQLAEVTLTAKGGGFRIGIRLFAPSPRGGLSMRQDIFTPNESLIPPAPIPAEARAFTSAIHELLDGQPKDDATVEKALEGMDSMFELIAAGLYNLASMLVGEGEDSIRLVEAAVANTEVANCNDPERSRKDTKRALADAALTILEQRDPGSLAAPEGLEPGGTCIEDDDLDAAGVSGAELEQMMGGPDRDRVRQWLESLPTAVRTIFALRAVAGLSAAETAELLAEHGGPKAAGWTADAVRGVFRQGLCSLASQLIQATVR